MIFYHPRGSAENIFLVINKCENLTLLSNLKRKERFLQNFNQFISHLTSRKVKQTHLSNTSPRLLNQLWHEDIFRLIIQYPWLSENDSAFCSFTVNEKNVFPFSPGFFLVSFWITFLRLLYVGEFFLGAENCNKKCRGRPHKIHLRAASRNKLGLELWAK